MIQDAALCVLDECVELAGLEAEGQPVEEGEGGQQLGGLAVGRFLGEGEGVQHLGGAGAQQHGAFGLWVGEAGGEVREHVLVGEGAQGQGPDVAAVLPGGR
ncbi:hypothetical protein [Streptomyces sp. IBSBF 3136]|uniref:hypothetical protein n=1 Tax=Streptomyces sp. IBSBF 3136 TaxID=2903524 RepID=UPI002FDBE957